VVPGGLVGAEQLLAADPLGEVLIADEAGDVGPRPPVNATYFRSFRFLGVLRSLCSVCA
jgi:hypothetical protein